MHLLEIETDYSISIVVHKKCFCIISGILSFLMPGKANVINIEMALISFEQSSSLYKLHGVLCCHMDMFIHTACSIV